MPLSPYRDARSCSFCRQSDETLVAEHAQICSPCVRLARDVVAEAGRPPRGEGG
jgi:hypothetical protein